MNLDDAVLIRAGDGGKVLASLEGIGAQCDAGARGAAAASWGPAFERPDEILVAGMGGSALGAGLLASLLAPALRVPLVVSRDSVLPAWVGERTLVVLSSYSGGTEETLDAAREALPRTPLTVAITTGGRLAQMMEAAGRPLVRLDPGVNPSTQPRFGLAGSLFALLGVIERAQAAPQFFAENGPMRDLLAAAGRHLDGAQRRYGLVSPRETNPAKEIAHFLENRACAVVASRHLSGAARAIANALNETAKSFAVPFEIPELNHHLMEGLESPASNRGALAFLFVETELYGSRLLARYAVTREVVARRGVAEITYRPEGDSPFAELLDTLVFGSYLSFYLALRHRQDPAAIPWVDHFKERLAQSSSESGGP